ncbi:hypothetical protein [Falsarthrobacter nasiphocae]|uniref:Uncharacterized protein n=1 Tax=Falsarthrobacter nasiphocae TaxID=189863 RepID=A0AAE4C757_9MICC|nr:hypothetical protein [Falsarthrobacter nasiphocae]MDR6892897.1 hypothetical protein [Falsarthrobacter nasiphocae]
MTLSRRQILGTAALAAPAVALTGAVAAKAEPVRTYSPLTVNVFSNAPVPGAFTAGKISIRNNTGETIPAGAWIDVTFVDAFTGQTNTGFNATLTADNPLWILVSKNSPSTFRISTRKDLAPGARRDLTWSNAWFNIGKRNAVLVQQVWSPTVFLANEAPQDRYDNFGRGI